jgi:hypothetical protein
VCLPSVECSPLTLNTEIDFEKSTQPQFTTNDAKAHSWNGFKVSMSIWNHGLLHIEPLIDKIRGSFNNTGLDYAVESYYRNARLNVDQSFDNGAFTKLRTLTRVLRSGLDGVNPLIQSLSLSSELYLSILLRGIQGVLNREGLEASFLRSNSNTTQIAQTLQVGNSEFVIIGKGASQRFAESSTSLIPDLSNTSTPLLDIDISGYTLKGGNKETVLKGDEVVFGSNFYPCYDLHTKRSSFFIISLEDKLVSAFTYNWNTTDSNAFFLKLVKVLNWAKIYRQFQDRRNAYVSKRLESLHTSVTSFGKKLYGFSVKDASKGEINEPETLSATMASRFRGLDFLYHIGSFDAIKLQEQIVDFLEYSFRNGRIIVETGAMKDSSDVVLLSPHPSTSEVSFLTTDILEEKEPIDQVLSLKDIARLLETIELIHSSSAPIFFSECRNSLVEKWDHLMRTNSMDSDGLISLGLSTANVETFGQSENQLEVKWFKKLIGDFIADYATYLEHLGMQKAKVDMPKIHKLGKYGGSFAISPSNLIEVESTFMVRFFTSGTILVQLGFYDYFATINVLSFAHSFNQSNTSKDFDFECKNMKLFSHIVSCILNLTIVSYDFHLRYIQNILGGTSLSFPVDLIRVLRTFVALNPKKGRFSRNRIYHDFAEFEDQGARKLFEYMLINSSSYGFTPVMYNGIVIAATCSSDVPVTPSSSSIHLEQMFRNTLIFCPNHSEEEKEGKFAIEFFTIVANNSTVFPYKSVEIGIQSNMNEQNDPLEEYISAGYYLRDIVNNFRSRLQQALSQVFFNDTRRASTLIEIIYGLP